MNHLPQAVPSIPSDRQHASRSARWTAGFIVALGFGFMGSTLIDAFEPAGRGISATSVTAPLPTADAAIPGDLPEIDEAVRTWTWETRSAGGKPATRQDLEELWLAR